MPKGKKKGGNAPTEKATVLARIINATSKTNLSDAFSIAVRDKSNEWGYVLDEHRFKYVDDIEAAILTRLRTPVSRKHNKITLDGDTKPERVIRSLFNLGEHGDINYWLDKGVVRSLNDEEEEGEDEGEEEEQPAKRTSRRNVVEESDTSTDGEYEDASSESGSDESVSGDEFQDANEYNDREDAKAERIARDVAHALTEVSRCKSEYVADWAKYAASPEREWSTAQFDSFAWALHSRLVGSTRIELTTRLLDDIDQVASRSTSRVQGALTSWYDHVDIKRKPESENGVVRYFGGTHNEAEDGSGDEVDSDTSSQATRPYPPSHRKPDPDQEEEEKYTGPSYDDVSRALLYGTPVEFARAVEDVYKNEWTHADLDALLDGVTTRSISGAFFVIDDATGRRIHDMMKQHSDRGRGPAYVHWWDTIYIPRFHAHNAAADAKVKQEPPARGVDTLADASNELETCSADEVARLVKIAAIHESGDKDDFMRFAGTLYNRLTDDGEITLTNDLLSDINVLMNKSKSKSMQKLYTKWYTELPASRKPSDNVKKEPAPSSARGQPAKRGSSRRSAQRDNNNKGGDSNALGMLALLLYGSSL